MTGFSDLTEAVTSLKAATTAQIQRVREDVATLLEQNVAQQTSLDALAAIIAAGVTSQAEVAAAKAEVAALDASLGAQTTTLREIEGEVNAYDPIPGSPAPPPPPPVEPPVEPVP